MVNNKFKPYLKWGVLYSILLIMYLLQSTPGLLEIMSLKPWLLVSFAVCIAMFESVMQVAVFSAISGLLLDITTNSLLGFYGVSLMVCCVTISLACTYLMHIKILNAIIFVTITTVMLNLLSYFFYFVIWGYADTHIVVIGKIIPTVIYTIITSPIMFLLVKRLHFSRNLSIVS